MPTNRRFRPLLEEFEPRIVPASLVTVNENFTGEATSASLVTWPSPIPPNSNSQTRNIDANNYEIRAYAEGIVSFVRSYGWNYYDHYSAHVTSTVTISTHTQPVSRSVTGTSQADGSVTLKIAPDYSYELGQLIGVFLHAYGSADHGSASMESSLGYSFSLSSGNNVSHDEFFLAPVGSEFTITYASDAALSSTNKSFSGGTFADLSTTAYLLVNNLVATDLSFSESSATPEVNFEYGLDRYDLGGDLKIGFYWSTSQFFEDRIGSAGYTRTVPKGDGTTKGYHNDHFSASLLGTRPANATHLVMKLDPDDKILENYESDNDRALEIPAEIAVTGLEWGANQDGLDFTYQISEIPLPTDTTLQVYWATGASYASSIGSPIFSIPAQKAVGSYGPIHVPKSALANPPVGATHLVVVADADGDITEADEENNCKPLVLPDLKISAFTWNAHRGTFVDGNGDEKIILDPQRGVDYAYEIQFADLLQNTQVAFYWSKGQEFKSSNLIGDPLTSEDLVDISVGKYGNLSPFNQEAHWGVVPPEAKYVLMVLDPGNRIIEGNKKNNVKPLLLHSEQDILTGAVSRVNTTPSARMELAFAPKGDENQQPISLSEAEVVLGVDHFNWVQWLTEIPDTWKSKTLYNLDLSRPLGIKPDGTIFYSDTEIEAEQKISQGFRNVPYIDPIASADPDDTRVYIIDFEKDGIYDSLSKVVSWLPSVQPSDAYFYYWNENPIKALLPDGSIQESTLSEVQYYTEANSLVLRDTPSIPTWMIQGATRKNKAFTTTLVGVLSSSNPLSYKTWTAKNYGLTTDWKTDALTADVTNNSGKNPSSTVEILSGGVFGVQTSDEAQHGLTLATNVGFQGQSLTLSVVGADTHFVQGTTTASFGPGITIQAVQVVDAYHVNLVLTIAGNASIGLRDLTLTTGDEVAVRTAGFEVKVGKTLSAVVEDSTTHTGQTVASLLTNLPDSDLRAFKGIAVMGTTGSGTWEYSKNAGVTWLSIGTVSSAHTLLLLDTYRFRFKPAVNWNGTALLTFYSWDRTTGTAEGFVDLSSPTATGTGTAFTAQLAGALVPITPVNDAPTLPPATPLLPALGAADNNSAGFAVSLLLSGITEVDPNALQGAALIGSTGTGTWQFSLNAGVTWKNFGVLSIAAAQLLRDTDLIRFVPKSTFNGQATLTYRAWDRTTGVASGTVNLTSATTWGGKTAYSVGTRKAVLLVNTAPVLNPAPATWPAILEDTTAGTGQLVSTLVNGFLTDANTGALKGIAISGLSGNGRWQYSLDNGVSWPNLTSASETSALLLRATDRLRFLPAANWNGTATLTLHGWDRTLGKEGTPLDLVQMGVGDHWPCSAATRTVSLVVTPVNDAPTQPTTSISLPGIHNNDSNPTGMSIGLFLSGALDVDAGALQGIAILGAAGGGVWQFSTTAGASWQNLGVVTTSTARLLRDTDLVRFVPNATFKGTATLSFRAWDQTKGTAGQTTNLSNATLFGGKTAFSLNQRSALLVVDDAP